MRRIFAVVMVLMWQTETFAAYTCNDLFSRPPIAERSFDTKLMSDRFQDINSFNRKVKFLNFLTKGVQERATNEELKVVIDNVNFNIIHNLPFEVLKDHEGMAIDVALAYASVKLPEPRVLFLRQKLSQAPLTKEDRKLQGQYRAELNRLEKLRKKNLAIIGENYIQYREILRAIQSFKKSENPTFVKRANFLLQHFGLTREMLRHVPELQEYVDQMSPSGLDPMLRPSTKDLAALFSAKDPNLAPEEAFIAKTAKIDRDIKVQVIANFFRHLSAILGDQLFTKNVAGLFKKLMTKFRAGDETDAMLGRIGIQLDRASVMTSQSGAVDHLILNLKTPRERYLYFRAMIARFGASDTPGIPKFVMTLALRENAMPVWEQIKDYVRTNGGQDAEPAEKPAAPGAPAASAAAGTTAQAPAEPGGAQQAPHDAQMAPATTAAQPQVEGNTGESEKESESDGKAKPQVKEFTANASETDLKRYEQVNFVLGPNKMTLLDAMEKAEEARQGGFLDAIDPARAVSFGIAKSVVTAGMFAMLAVALYKYIGSDDSKKDKGDDKDDGKSDKKVGDKPAAPAGVAPSAAASAAKGKPGEGAPAAPGAAPAAPPAPAHSGPGLINADGRFQELESELTRLSVMDRDVLLAVLKKAQDISAASAK